MSQAWYIQYNERLVGPITSAKLKQLADAATIGPDTKLRLGIDGKWQDAEKVRGLFPVATTTKAVAHCPPRSEAAAVQPLVSRPKSQVRPQESTGHASARPYAPPTSSAPPVAVGAPPPGSNSDHSLRQAFRSIWLRPRQTMRWIIAERPARDAIIIAMIAFGLKFVDNCLLTNEGALVDSSLLFAPIGIPFSALIGVIVLYVLGFLHKIVGEAFGGRGNYQSLRTAFAWSLVPTMCSLAITIMLLLATLLVPSILNLPNALLNLPFWGLAGWGIVIEVAGISAAHEFSIVKAVITFVLSAIVLTLGFMIAVTGAVMLTL